ncbi:hypothetical protein [Bradyrhizobium sp. AUGA SZCCT0431]|uniref:hypothetical protein n=1 Tax=Bradyrhizobium sp. AUGA SZCCT0431 TaxID=2807674 RepID=UPI001BA95A1A|nr:hypothetical protein [Bradyrhizobium sp. AUGA SZCCT0431]MBR1146683.1 hypothetical protein [Bradyrhizobium sp. AUGA SZCCT0431]
MSDVEQASVIAFTSNKQMRDAVKKVLLAQIYEQGTIQSGKTPNESNWAFVPFINEFPKSNEQIGEEIRATIHGLNFLKAAFDRLDEVQAPAETKKPKNPAL